MSVTDNLLLGAFPRFTGSRPRGDVKIEVQFRVDADGILHVRASDQESGQAQEAHLQVLGAPVGPGYPGDVPGNKR